MATLKMTGCMKLVSKMSDADQDALLQRLDQYQADGVAPERAQLMAAQDMLAEIQGERAQLFDLLKEQHPDLFRVSEEPTAQPSRQRGINVRNDGDNRYADLIVDGEKTMESRDSDSLRPYVGQAVGIIRTGEGPAKLIGSVKVGEPIEVGEQKFRELEAEHLVPAGSAFDIKSGRTKFLYPLTDAKRFDEERDVDTRGIVAREVQFSRSRSPLGLYSALAESVDGIKTNSAPAQGWKDAIKGLVNKGQVKADEVEWTGLIDWLDLQQGKVTKEQVADYLKRGGVQVEETQLGGPRPELVGRQRLAYEYDQAIDRAMDADVSTNPTYIANLPPERRAPEEQALLDAWNRVSENPEENSLYERRAETKYGQYTLPGGENYREVLLTLPPSSNAARLEQERDALNATSSRDPRYVDLTNRIKAAEYRSKHWDQPNIIAHIRANDRTDADGNKVLFVEEIQSDWGQEGKKKGFREDSRQKELRAKSKALRGEYEAAYQQLLRQADSLSDAEYERRLAQLRDMEDAVQAAAIEGDVAMRYNEERVPVAPFVTKTEGWLNLALKRIMVMAAEGGYDKVAFVNGEQSADRYDLSKQVESISYKDNGDGTYKLIAAAKDRGIAIPDQTVERDGLTDLVGKEVADKIISGEGTPFPKGSVSEGMKRLSGLDLKVGGEGMKAFYDTIVPTALKKLLPKVGGGQVGMVEMFAKGRDIGEVVDADGEVVSFGATREIYEDEWGPDYTFRRTESDANLAQPGFDVTPAMREKVASTGLPTFSPRRNMFGQPAPAATWLVPDDTYLDRNVIFQLQDKQVDLKRVIAAVKTATGSLADKWDAYLQEELYHGRAAKATKDFASKELKPLLEDMQSRGVSMAEFEEFLHNRHAEERNNQIAKINAAMPDGGSGIDTADARAYLAGLTPAKRRAFDALAARVDAITAGTRQLLVTSGLETQDTIDKWEGAYGNYVPLMREEADYGMPSGTGTGQGFSVRGSSSKRATGSSRPVVDILANLVMQRERVITRAEKTRVGTALYGLAVQNPNTDFWLAVDPTSVKDPAKTIQDLINLGINPLDAQNIIEEPKQTYTDPKTGLVTQRVNPAMRSADNVLAVRINGEDRFVFFNANDERAKRMSAALKNLDGQQLNMVLGASAVVSRYFASINTQYNPLFGAINVLRDTQGAVFNLTTTPIADKKAEVLAGVGGAAKGIYAALRASRQGRSYPPGSWAQLWDEFQNEGGQTGFRDMFKDSNDRAKGLESELKQMSEGTLKQAGRAVFDWLSDYNETLENAVRLSAYKAAKGKGLSNQQAASIAKNLTVNFNRKGNVGAQAGALYAFFNASVQGTARLAETLKGPAGKKILYGGLLLGSAQALLLAAAGFDDDEPPGFIKERNLVIPTGDGKYLTLPMPLGLNVIPNTGRVLTEWALSGGKDSGKRIAQITGAMLDMFNPIGNSGWSLQTLAPTAIDPLAALAENKDWSGKPIAKKDMSGTDPSPGFTRAKDTASWISKQLSYVLNLATGGTDYKPGGFSPTPDQIDYLLGQATGGVGREILKVSQAIESSVTGEELPTYKVPLAGRFYGDTKEQSAVSSRYYANITELNGHDREIKGRRENRGNVAEYLREYPEARLATFANQVERDVSKLRKRKREMLEQDRPAESIKMIEMQITRRMKQLNDRVEQVQGAQ